MKELAARYGWGFSCFAVLVICFWLLALVVLPNIVLLNLSFKPYLPVVEMGGPKDVYGLQNYTGFFDSPIQMRVFLRTILYSCLATFICFLISYPVAYYLAKLAKPANALSFFLLLLIPLWVSEILRTFAWFIILSYQGPLNAVITALGGEPVRWISGYNAIMVGLIYSYVLFMLFPLYSAISTLDSNQIEAAEDLGASRLNIHWRIIMPHARPGIASGCIMVFMLCAGSVIVPNTLQSTSSRWFTEIIQQFMMESGDWNTGAAYAFLLLVSCIIFISLVMRVLKVNLVDIAK